MDRQRCAREGNTEGNLQKERERTKAAVKFTGRKAGKEGKRAKWPEGKGGKESEEAKAANRR